MTSSPGPELVIIGDDLSGSAESAALFGRYGYDVRIGLGAVPDTGAIRVVDSDTRQLTPEQARLRAAGVIDDVAAGRIVLKLDSLLRGHLVPHLAALAPQRHPVVFASALPVQDRIVAGGVAYERGRVIGGRPLAELITPLAAESIPASRDVAALAGRLAEATGRGRIAICDAVDDADLDRLVLAASGLPGVRFAGAAGLIAALARRMSPGPPGAPGPRSEPGPGTWRPEPVGPVLCVLGTAAASARRQLDALVAAEPGTRVWTRPPGGWPSGTAAEVREQLATHRPAVLRLPVRDSAAGRERSAVGPDDAGLVAELAELAGRAADDPTVPLVLSGGQTARAVLDRLGVTTLEVTAEIHHGAVASRCDDGRVVVTRPGSFGEDDSLVRILAHLTSSAPVPGRPS